jgi:lipoic acid synthetase
MDDIINTGCKIITIGQYLQPSIKHYPIHRFVTPDTFDLYQKVAIDKGFIFVESSPLVRSSYHADKYTG